MLAVIDFFFKISSYMNVLERQKLISRSLTFSEYQSVTVAEFLSDVEELTFLIMKYSYIKIIY